MTMPYELLLPVVELHPAHVRPINRVLVIDAAQIATAVAKNNDALGGLVASVNQALPNATGIIIDARSNSKMEDLDAYYFDVFMRQTLAAILDSNVVLGSARYRMHNGYATQTSSGANFYSSSLVSSAPQLIQGRAKTKTPPVAFIVNQHSPAFTEILSGMQLANRAFVIQEGERAPEAGGGVFTLELPDKIKVRMRTSELINPDGSVDLQPDVVLQQSTTDDAAMKEALREPCRRTKMDQSRIEL